jgi:hypothetical protein
VSLKALTATYNRYVEDCKSSALTKPRAVLNEDALTSMGLDVHAKMNICVACDHKATRPHRCCDAYDANRRTKLKAVKGLRLHTSRNRRLV